MKNCPHCGQKPPLPGKELCESCEILYGPGDIGGEYRYSRETTPERLTDDDAMRMIMRKFDDAGAPLPVGIRILTCPVRVYLGSGEHVSLVKHDSGPLRSREEVAAFLEVNKSEKHMVFYTS